MAEQFILLILFMHLSDDAKGWASLTILLHIISILREYIFFLPNYNKENKQVGLNTLLWGSLLLHTASPIDAQTFGMFPR